jgi:MoxR-like ATPase
MPKVSTQPSHPPHFTDATDVVGRLAKTGYLADEDIATIVFLADRLSKPLLIEGPAGVGKTELAKSLASLLGIRSPPSTRGASTTWRRFGHSGS